MPTHTPDAHVCLSTFRQRKSLLFERLEIVDTTPSHLRVNTWTKSEWLDVLDISFAPLP